MSTTDEFTRACQATAKSLRRVPAQLRRELSTAVKDEVATPLAARIASAATGPWAPILAAGTKARAGADPTIVVGGARPRVSGGAGPRALVFGVEFGGHTRVTVLPPTNRRRGHRRHTTRQFAGKRAPFVFPTIERSLPWVLDTFADLTMATLEKSVNDGR